MSWANGYVGLPFKDQGRDRDGCDCWGLARLVYANELGIHLLSYTSDYTGAAEQAEVAALIGHETDAGPWVRRCRPKPFDLLLFRLGRFETHVGIHVTGTRMLHMARGEQAKIEDYHNALWGKRYVGAYSHAARSLKVPS